MDIGIIIEKKGTIEETIGIVTENKIVVIKGHFRKFR
jgi:hypothetical protein